MQNKLITAKTLYIGVLLILLSFNGLYLFKFAPSDIKQVFTWSENLFLRNLENPNDFFAVLFERIGNIFDLVITLCLSVGTVFYFRKKKKSIKFLKKIFWGMLIFFIIRMIVVIYKFYGVYNRSNCGSYDTIQCIRNFVFECEFFPLSEPALNLLYLVIIAVIALPIFLLNQPKLEEYFEINKKKM